jgi:GAF domain-containing protein
LQQSERELSIRNRIAEIFLTIPDDEMYGEMLRVVLEVTESQYGIFGYIGEDGALVCPSLTREVWDRCQIPDKDIVFPRQTWGGLWGYALIDKKALYSNKPLRVPKGHIPILRALDVPIIHRREVIGNLLVGNKALDYGKEDCALLEAIANYIAPILHARLLEDRKERERKRAEEEVRRHLERAEALREIDRAITSTLDLSGVLDIILEELERVIPYHSAGIFLFSDATARLTAGRGFPDLERVLQISYPVQEDALTRQVLQERRPLVLADAQADERFLARGGTEYVRSWIGIPLIVKGRAVGFLTVDHREPGIYGEESAEIAQRFASQAAIAIENARLFQEAQRELAERKRVEEELLQR